MRWKPHVRFGRRAAETDPAKAGHRAAARPHTYVPTTAGWLYLAIVLDTYSRRVIGWSMDSHRKTQLVCDAVTMAVSNRGGQVAGVIHHSDRGGEYTSDDLERALRKAGALPSMGSVADSLLTG